MTIVPRSIYMYMFMGSRLGRKIMEPIGLCQDLSQFRLVVNKVACTRVMLLIDPYIINPMCTCMWSEVHVSLADTHLHMIMHPFNTFLY